MFFTGSSRTADALLDDQRKRTEAGDAVDARRAATRRGDRSPHPGRSHCRRRDSVRRAHARALGREARALAGHVESGHRPLVRGRAGERSGRWQADRCGRRGIPPLSRRRPCGAPRCTGGRRPGRGSLRLRPRRLERSSFVPEHARAVPRRRPRRRAGNGGWRALRRGFRRRSSRCSASPSRSTSSGSSRPKGYARSCSWSGTSASRSALRSATGARSGVAVTYVDEGDDLHGTGGALRVALDDGRACRTSFGVLYGDSYLPTALAPVFDGVRARPTARRS